MEQELKLGDYNQLISNNENKPTDCIPSDPIDANAISNVVAKSRSASHPVYIGSLKSNFG